MTKSPCHNCENKKTPKNELPCAACDEPAKYADSLGHATIPQERRDVTVSRIEEKKRRGMPKCGWPKKDLPESAKPNAENDVCPECGRKKAKNIHDVSNGYCPKWWAIRDPDAEADCKNFSREKEVETKKPNIPDWINGKIDHPSKPCAEIPKNIPFPMPKSSPSKNNPLKFDLSAFKKITFDRRVLGEPMVRISAKNEIAFNVCAADKFNLMKCKSFDVYMDKDEVRTMIAFVPLGNEDGTFKTQYQPSYVYFNSIKLIRELSVPAGRYPVSLVDGALVVEVAHG